MKNKNKKKEGILFSLLLSIITGIIWYTLLGGINGRPSLSNLGMIITSLLWMIASFFIALESYKYAYKLK